MCQSASCAAHGSGSSPRCQLSPKLIHTGTHSAAQSHAPRFAINRVRRTWNAVRAPSRQIGAVRIGQSRRSRSISCSSRSTRARGSTRTVATISCGRRLMGATLTRGWRQEKGFPKSAFHAQSVPNRHSIVER
jgi:hypothetical protein